MTFEELKKEFKDQGFRIEGNQFIHEFEDQNTTINGVHPKKRFEMTFICEGSIKTVTNNSDSDEGKPLYEFDVLGPGREPAFTICFGSFDEFTRLV